MNREYSRNNISYELKRNKLKIIHYYLFCLNAQPIIFWTHFSSNSEHIQNDVQRLLTTKHCCNEFNYLTTANLYISFLI